MSNTTWHEHAVSRELRAAQKQQRPAVIWFTGLSGSGKSTIANAVDALLLANGNHTYLLDGDNIRHGLNNDLGFNEHDRNENIRRIAEVAKLMTDAGLLVLCAFVSPSQKHRDRVRDQLTEGEFIEVFVDTPLAICEQRDPKGLYKKARQGDIKDFTGVSAAYEPPQNPEIHLQMAELLNAASLDATHAAPDASTPSQQAAQQVVAYLRQRGYIR